MLEKMELEFFTAFESLHLDFSPGVNLFIGANGTGKTHLLKLLYVALSTQREERKRESLERKLANVFLPQGKRLGRLAHRLKGGVTCKVHIIREGKLLDFHFTNHSQQRLKGYENHWDAGHSAVYIPVKEMLADAPGLLSLYNERQLHLEEIYPDIVQKAFLPPLKGRPSARRRELLELLQQIMAGKVMREGEQFFLKDERGELEFSLVAEGLRKIALLWLLIQNGTLLNGATLFWDEPEANLNPCLLKELVKILLHLQREGVQIFIATHSYVLLQLFELQATDEDKVRFYSFKRDASGRIISEESQWYQDVQDNAIGQAYDDLYNQKLAQLGL
ncbi:MAG TPA: AAA family ATPase [Thermoflexia bacterium]|nr:AAA family ATPase [Thermoflexia bacterium]